MFPKAPSDSVARELTIGVYLQIGTDSAYKDSIASHIEVSYNAETGGWGEPRIVQDPWLRVHGLSPGLNYGSSFLAALKVDHRKLTVCQKANNAMKA
ncbi:hypothetical protein HRR77_001344 [Exophiala dermatitidis]|nr:hypothetical protein HRR77_001344 [Exophiala dermatitidis]